MLDYGRRWWRTRPKPGERPERHYRQVGRCVAGEIQHRSRSGVGIMRDDDLYYKAGLTQGGNKPAPGQGSGPLAEKDAARAAEEARREIERCNKELAELGLQMALDAAGIIDPTPTSDLISAANSLRNNDPIGAGLTLLGVVPYVGDLLGKSLKGTLLASRIAKIKQRLEKALRTLKVAEEALKKANNASRAEKLVKVALTSIERGAIKLHRELPLIRNPRALAKHPGPIPIQRLTEELAQKGFRHVKEGQHGLQGLPENSDIFIRKILVDGEEVYDCVRIDRRLPNPEFNRGMRGSPSQIQAQDKLNRRIHSVLDEPEVPPTRDMVEQMQQGKFFKGDFTHWHHEQFPASERNLATYLTPPYRGADGKIVFQSPPGLKKFDSSGQLVLTRPLRR